MKKCNLAYKLYNNKNKIYALIFTSIIFCGVLGATYVIINMQFDKAREPEWININTYLYLYKDPEGKEFIDNEKITAREIIIYLDEDIPYILYRFFTKSPIDNIYYRIGFDISSTNFSREYNSISSIFYRQFGSDSYENYIPLEIRSKDNKLAMLPIYPVNTNQYEILIKYEKIPFGFIGKDLMIRPYLSDDTNYSFYIDYTNYEIINAYEGETRGNSAIYKSKSNVHTFNQNPVITLKNIKDDPCRKLGISSILIGISVPVFTLTYNKIYSQFKNKSKNTINSIRQDN